MLPNQRIVDASTLSKQQLSDLIAAGQKVYREREAGAEPPRRQGWKDWLWQGVRMAASPLVRWRLLKDFR